MYSLSFDAQLKDNEDDDGDGRRWRCADGAEKITERRKRSG